MSDDALSSEQEPHQYLKKHGVVARLLHWITGGLVIYGFAKGLNNVSDLERPGLWLFEVAFAIGLGGLLAARYIWMNRFNDGASRLPETSSKLQRKLVWLGHNAIYIGLFIIIFSGLAIAGLFYSPMMNSLLMDIVVFIHNASVTITEILIIGHVLVALYHRFWLRDGLMQTMTSLDK